MTLRAIGCITMCEKGENTGYMGTTRPTVAIQLARDIITKYYGLKTLEIIELDSSGDRNFRVTAQQDRNHILYILKVVNSHESIPRFHESIAAIMDRLLENGFVSSKMIPTKNGEPFLRIPIPTSSGKEELCLVKLLTYLPGQPLRSLSVNSTTQFELGQLLAHFHLTLQDFPTTGLSVDPNNPWGAENPLVVLKYLTQSLSDEIVEIVTKISETLHRILHNSTTNLTKGVIHGDLGDLNIIVNPDRPSSTSDIKQKYGIIDFNDVCHSFIILEVGRLIADQLLAYAGQTLKTDLNGEKIRPDTTGDTIDKGPNGEKLQTGQTGDTIDKGPNGDKLQTGQTGDTIDKGPNGDKLQPGQIDNKLRKDPSGEELCNMHNGDTIRKEFNDNFQNAGLQMDDMYRKDLMEFQQNNNSDKNFHDLNTTREVGKMSRKPEINGDVLIEISIQVLKGYLSITELSPLDLSALYWSIGGSFSQYLVLCEYNKLHQPENPFAAEAARDSDILILEWDKINPDVFLDSHKLIS